MRELTNFRLALNELKKSFERFNKDVTVNGVFKRQMDAYLEDSHKKLYILQEAIEGKESRLKEFRRQESLYLDYANIIDKAWKRYLEEQKKETAYIYRVSLYKGVSIKCHLYIPAERIPQYIEELKSVSELLQQSDPYLNEERDVVLEKYNILKSTFTWFGSLEASYESFLVPDEKWKICKSLVDQLKVSMPEFLEKKPRLGLKTSKEDENIGKKIEDVINHCQSLDYKKLSKGELCKWHLTCDQYIKKLKEAVAQITEDTPENRKMLRYIANLQASLSDLDKRFYSRFVEMPEEKRKLTKAEKQTKDFEQLKIFMWGKRLYPDKMNKEDSWYENESRLVAVPYQEDIQTYLKNYGAKVRNGREARIEMEGKEDTDEWGWLCLANMFLPFCIRYIKTLSNETTMYYFYTFNVVTSKYGYDFDDAITNRIYWLNDKGLLK